MSRKAEIELQLANIKNEIKTIDEKSNQSFCYFFFHNDDTKRQRLIQQKTTLEAELLYAEDDEKREKYKEQRNKDPLKKSRRK
jgi:hypothetical protein